MLPPRRRRARRGPAAALTCFALAIRAVPSRADAASWAPTARWPCARELMQDLSQLPTAPDLLAERQGAQQFEAILADAARAAPARIWKIDKDPCRSAGRLPRATSRAASIVR